MRVLLVVNPAASSVRADVTSEVFDVLRRRHEVTRVETAGRGDATRIARTAAEEGFGCVAVLSGDGTLNEVANGLVGGEVVLAPLPGGSTDVFARSIGLPRRAHHAAAVVADALSGGRSESIGVGRVFADGHPGRVFLCHVGVGWDAALVAEVERRRRLGRRATVALYTWAGVRTYAGYEDRRQPRLTASVLHSGPTAPTGSTRPSTPDETAMGDEPVPGCFALVQNSDPYTFVGPLPLRVAPLVDRHAGLQVTTLRSLTAPVLLRSMLAAASGRGVRAGRAVSVRSGATGVRIAALGAPAVESASAGVVPYQVDGDHLGDAEVLRFEHSPGALRVIDPR